MKRSTFDRIIHLFAFGSVVWVFVIGALGWFGLFGDPNKPMSLGSLIAWFGPLIITIAVSAIYGSAEMKQSSEEAEVQLRKQQDNPKMTGDMKVINFCAFAGAATFFILNIIIGVVTVPGGFIGGAIVGGLGAG
jgi:hypothetical protein